MICWQEVFFFYCGR